jgi:hypothetical protein
MYDTEFQQNPWNDVRDMETDTFVQVMFWNEL